MVVVMRALLIRLVGRDSEGRIFDTTEGEEAKALYGKEGPIVVFVGMDKLVPGLEAYLKEAKVGEEKELELSPSEAFGFRRPELVVTYSLTHFKKNNILPRVGAVLEFEDAHGRRRGIVRSVGSGRVLVDFNHPLAGKKVKYWVKVEKELNDEEKAEELKKRFPHLLKEIKMGDVIEVEVNDEAVKNVETLLLLSPVKELLKEVFDREVYFNIPVEKVAKAVGGTVEGNKIKAEMDEKMKAIINKLFKEPLIE